MRQKHTRIPSQLSLTNPMCCPAGYYAIQSTKPQTLAYAMNDSPVGLLAWIVEKFYMSSDCGDLEKSFSKDELLTNVALYWFTQRAPSSFRIYYEASSTGDFDALLKSYCPVRTLSPSLAAVSLHPMMHRCLRSHSLPII